MASRLTVEGVRKRVVKVERQGNDPECAHSDEDKLHLDVLLAIANGAENPQELAAEAALTRFFDFPRWMA